MSLSRITIQGASIKDFSQIRNEALSVAKSDWVLFTDSDERISRELEHEIQQAITSHDYDAFYLKREDQFLGQKLRHGETGHIAFIRLARKEFGRWQRPVHEKWVGKGRVGKLHYPLQHYPHPNLSTFLTKIDFYSTLEAKYRYGLGVKSSLLKIFLYPLFKFKLNYFIKLGFLDGTPGAIMALMMSFHSYLTWTKLYLLWHKK